MMLILSQNQTSIHKEHFRCGTFSYQQGFITEKHVQRGPRYKKSRCPWDGFYLCTSITLRALPSDKQQLYESFSNERWTGNLVPTRITLRAGAHPSTNFSKNQDFSKFSKFRPNFEVLKKLASDRSFPQYYHFSS